ncbi:Brix domain-containing protein-like protein [Blumeria hordei DH14]|uniref:Ribosome production factor 2 homolog n=1 Tax=Blumeria graminis f. sp. hordei (strain DH14) TaxID=546991 RepID=N1JDN9_BLUG1|nr:Brix domain-containing protein-like protein [Blumeria hordei DH14]
MLKQMRATSRAVEKKAPKPVENPKKTLFLRGTKCSEEVKNALTDLYQLKIPLAKKFTKKNEIHPFDDPSSLEFFSEKNDASLLLFGSTSKRRPHNITLVRTFSYKVLDMIELGLNAKEFLKLSQFKSKKCAVGLTPMLLFAGTPFENPISDEYTLLKSMFIDLFKGQPSNKVDVEGLQYIICISAEDQVEGESLKPTVHFRTYLVQTKRSGQKFPRVEVEEMGPRMDFSIRRVKEADESMMKEALKKARTSEERPKKNISTDIVGDKMGRIHLGKQDLTELQTRKMKGLKRSRDVNTSDAQDEEEKVSRDGGKKVKRS